MHFCDLYQTKPQLPSSHGWLATANKPKKLYSWGYFKVAILLFSHILCL
jgi:hypothetical protein